MAIVMALLLKAFAVEAYKIPSGSMQPTLIGDESAGVFDRMLVDKLIYKLRDPRRFEVVIFRYPLDRSKNFVKRLVGIGPEDLKIERGDLWRRDDASQPWTILRRPKSVQRATWKALDLLEREYASWEPASYVSDWSFAGRSIEAVGDGRARFQPERTPIRDWYFDGYPEPLPSILTESSSSSRNFVGDLRVDGKVQARPGTRAVVIELEEGSLRYRFRIPGPAASEDAKPSVAILAPADQVDALRSRVEAGTPYRLPSDRAVDFDAQNLDDLLELSIDGEAVLTMEIASTLDQRSGATLEVEGEGARFDDLMVYRDIYYTGGNEAWLSIPDGHYAMLGDNTQDSSDSREWSLVRYEVTESDGEKRILQGNRRGGDNPFVVPGLPGGSMTRFRDEWGETHWFPTHSAQQLTPSASPFVPRNMILGHAVAVFWPLDPFKDLYRLEWVN